MKQRERLVTLGIGIVVGALISFGISAQQQQTGKRTQLLKKDVVGCEGKEVVVSTLEVGPRVSPDHFHPGESFTYLAEGTQTRTAQGKEPVTMQAGGLIYDAPYQVHKTENTSPVKLFIVRILDKGKPETSRMQ